MEDTGLEKNNQETVGLITVLAFCVSTASNEKSMSALKIVNMFSRNSLINFKLSSLTTLDVEKTLLNDLSMYDSFKERVVDVFAEQNTR